MKNAITWFEIPSTQLDRAQAFYEAVLNCKMRREPMGPAEGAILPFEVGGVGGCLLSSSNTNTNTKASAAQTGGTLVYLDVSPSLDAALARATEAGGTVALGRQALAPGMGFFAHITDLDGNRVGLHAPA